MSTLGTIINGDLTVTSGADPISTGYGQLTVAGNTTLAGTSTRALGLLTVDGNSTFNADVHIAGQTTFDSTVNFNTPATFSDIINVTNTVNSSSFSTGAVVVYGGIGVAKDTFLGGFLNVDGDSLLNGQLSVNGTSTFSSDVKISSGTETTSTSTGALQVAGGIVSGGYIRSNKGRLYLGVDQVLYGDSTSGRINLDSPRGDLYINQNGLNSVYINSGATTNVNISNTFQVNPGNVQILTTVDSTSITDGSLVIAGGLGIAKNIFTGANLTGLTTNTLTYGIGIFNNTAQSTSISTGAIIVSGGIGISKNAFVGGILDVAAGSNVASYVGSVRVVTSQNGANWIQTGDVNRTTDNFTPLKFSPLNNTNSILSINATNVKVDVTTSSTSTTTGALVVNGGIGVTGAAFIGGTTTHLGDICLSENNLYLRNDNTVGLVYNATHTGPLLFGNGGGALGTTSLEALQWNSSQIVTIPGTTDASSVSDGSLVVGGGIGIGKQAYFGSTINVRNTSWSSSSGNNIYLNAVGDSIYLRNTANQHQGEFESSTTTFRFKTNDDSSYTALQIDKTSGQISIFTTTDSSSISTGALVVSGGAAFTKNVFCGVNVDIANNLSVSGSISFNNTSDSISISSGGALTVAGGTSIAKKLWVGGDVNFLSTTDSYSNSSGALVLNGGLGIAKNISIAGNESLTGNLSVTGTVTVSNTVNLNSTSDASSISTGSLILAGGIGISKNIYGAGQLVITNTSSSAAIISGGVTIARSLNTAGTISVTNSANATSSSSGSITTLGGIGITQDLFVGGNSKIDGSLTVAGNISSSSNVIFTNTTDTISPSTGSVIISGGVGIAKSLNIGSTVASNSITSGALVVAGGIGVGSSLFVGGNQTLGGTITFGNNSGIAAPSINVRSVGTKTLFYDALSATTSDYAVGIESNGLWFSVPTNNQSNSFKWYGASTNVMTLNDLGTLSVLGTTESTSTSSGAFIVNGGAGISGNVYIGDKISVTGTSLFTSSATFSTDVGIGGLITSTNNTDSTTFSNGAFVTAGGIGIAKNVNIGGNMHVIGNEIINGSQTIAGITTISNTTDSSTAGNGAVVIAGGLGVAKTINVGGAAVFSGNATITGNLFVAGTTTTVDSAKVSVLDNVFLVNSGPSSSANSGYAMKRYQKWNDSGEGDVVTDTPLITGTAQNATLTTIVLDNSASTVDDEYDGCWIKITGGQGVNQVRRIKNYIGSTREVTIYGTLDETANPKTPPEGADFTTIPISSSTYAIFNSQYSFMVYDELNKKIVFGTAPLNPTDYQTVNIQHTVDIEVGNCTVDHTLLVDNITQKTASNGVSVEDITFKSSEISGVSAINGIPIDTRGIVTLVDNAAESIDIPDTMTYGSYQIFVSDTNNTGTSAIFNVSGSTGRAGSVARVTSCPGAKGESLHITWLADQHPQLTYLDAPSPATGASYVYNIRVLKSI